MQAGEYKFAFKVKYTYSGQDYELETHVVTLTLNKIDFTMSEGVNKIETTE
ncbi:MAG: hypothetical protein MJ233_00930 [Mycoplasmoidaceae bacterium]|nr:hypothetical protein [Mycoplasmoidaceae bacterium]